MLKQIRQAMEDRNNEDFFDTIVEIDETYVGGKPRKKDKHDDNPRGGSLKRGRGTKKTPIVAVVDREESLQDYINECSFRYNNRNIDSSFDLVLRNAVFENV